MDHGADSGVARPLQGLLVVDQHRTHRGDIDVVGRVAVGGQFVVDQRVVDVQDVPDALDRADILAFFENLGQQIIDLTEEDAVQDFVFRAPLSVRVTGFPPAACNGETITDPETGVQFAGVPIVAQGGSVPLTIEVFEDRLQ